MKQLPWLLFLTAFAFCASAFVVVVYGALGLSTVSVSRSWRAGPPWGDEFWAHR